MNLYKLRTVVQARCGVRILAERLGWHRKLVQKLLRGDLEPTRRQIVNLARALELNRWEFCEIFFPELMDERCRYWDAYRQRPEKEPKKRCEHQKEKSRDRLRYRVQRVRLWLKQAFWGVAAWFKRLFRR
ncbi:MAG: hypothetical protein J5633_04730 [Oscillospiraceae bacterium]|nr:hypothetical protein [Oscillospiraceae bacterium]